MQYTFTITKLMHVTTQSYILQKGNYDITNYPDSNSVPPLLPFVMSYKYLLFV